MKSLDPRYRIQGKIYLTVYFAGQAAQDIRKDKSPGNIAGESLEFATKTGLLWFGDALLLRSLGYVGQRVITSPVTYMIAGIVSAGAAISYAFWGKEGLSDYVEFMDDLVTPGQSQEIVDKITFTANTIEKEAVKETKEILDFVQMKPSPEERQATREAEEDFWADFRRFFELDPQLPR